MKLIRCGALGLEIPALLLKDGRRVSTAHLWDDYDENFFLKGGLGKLQAWHDEGCEGGGMISSEVRLGAPIARPSKIVCVGQNYSEHAREMGDKPPSEPVLFHKASSSWSGPFDPVTIPPGATQLDYEVELAVIVGKRAKEVSIEEAVDFIAGYSVFCDFSERAFQREHAGQWTKGKSYDSFGPAGPYLLTRDEVENHDDLDLCCRVNGEIRQQSNTSDMMKNVDELVSYISRFMTLLPGDVIATGTPSGVAMGMATPQYLRAGDEVYCGISLLGQMSNRVVSSDDRKSI